MHCARYKSESPTYAAKRDALLQAEIALRDQREAVAAMRRALPIDTEIEDYAFQHAGGRGEACEPGQQVHLSELVGNDGKALVIYQLMFGGAQKNLCPMCALWIDGYNGIAKHLHQVANVAVIAEAEVAALGEVASERGWSGLRFLSSAGTTFKRDFGFENDNKDQFPGVSVFVRQGGSLCHSYSGSAILGPDEYRGVDLLNPLWNTLDLTPGGRPADFMPQLHYDD